MPLTLKGSRLVHIDVPLHLRLYGERAKARTTSEGEARTDTEQQEQKQEQEQEQEQKQEQEQQQEQKKVDNEDEKENWTSEQPPNSKATSHKSTEESAKSAKVKTKHATKGDSKKATAKHTKTEVKVKTKTKKAEKVEKAKKTKKAEKAEKPKATESKVTEKGTAKIWEPGSPIYCVVINLDRRPERWDALQPLLKPSVDLGHLTVFRQRAMDGKKLSIPDCLVTESWSTSKNWKYVTKVFEGGEQCGYTKRTLRLTSGERGCAASHIEAWWTCLSRSQSRNSNEPLLVLEDDALPEAGFMKKVFEGLEALKDEDPDLLYLGWSQAAPWRRQVAEGVFEAEYLWTTVAYILWPRGASLLLAQTPVDQPVDNYMADMMASGDLRGFALVPEVVKQAKPWNVDNDIKHSDDKAWKKATAEKEKS